MTDDELITVKRIGTGEVEMHYEKYGETVVKDTRMECFEELMHRMQYVESKR